MTSHDDEECLSPSKLLTNNNDVSIANLNLTPAKKEVNSSKDEEDCFAEEFPNDTVIIREDLKEIVTN